MLGACSTHGRDEKYKQIFRQKAQVRLLGAPGRRWEDNIKVDVKKVECENIDWIHLT
jgi:hypothetical protein